MKTLVISIGLIDAFFCPRRTVLRLKSLGLPKMPAKAPTKTVRTLTAEGFGGITMFNTKTRTAFIFVLLMLSNAVYFAQETSTWQLSESRLVQMIGKDKFPTVSPDQNHVAYVETSGKKYRVVVDGLAQPEFDLITDLTFGLDGQHVTYTGTNANQSFYVVDGKVVERPSAAVGNRIEKGKSGWVMSGKTFNYVHDPVFSSDGSRFAFCGAERVNIDGEERPVNGVVIGTQIIFSPDSKHVLFMTIRSEGVFLNLDGQESPATGGIKADAYPHQTGKGIVFWKVLDWDRPLFAISPDSKRIAYRGYTNKNRMVMVIDGKAGAAHVGVGEPVFSADSKHVAYAAWDNTYFHAARPSFVVIDGVEQIYPGKGTGSNLQLILSRDGKRFAGLETLPSIFTGPAYGYKVFVDGVVSKRFDLATLPVFSPSGKHVAYFAGNFKKMQLFVDGAPVGDMFDGIFGMMYARMVVFDADDQFHYLVRKNIDENTSEIWRISATQKK